MLEEKVNCGLPVPKEDEEDLSRIPEPDRVVWYCDDPEGPGAKYLDD